MIDERLDFAGEHFCIADGLAALPQAAVPRRRVFGYTAHAGVINPDHDDRFDFAAADQVIGGDIRTPVLAAKCGGRIEKILAVLQIENRMSRVRFAVTGRSSSATRSWFEICSA